ncbi:MAG: PKD domain-containing protein [Cytophagales bacterium]|nr:PKD domain-containing protein [Cytophagales bacterium]
MTRLLSFALALMLAVPLWAQDFPKSKHWSFTSLQNWSEASELSEPDIEYHISRVPLKPRFQFKASQANPEIDPNRRMGVWVLHPEDARGSDNAYEFCFMGWQYLDVFARWNGGGRRITIPPASFAEAAHRNGSKMLGNIIFSWGDNNSTEISNMLKVENGRYVSALKLVDMAIFYGFDGWALNIESTTSIDKNKMVGFMQEIKTYAAEKGISDFPVLWYDARNNSGYISFYNRLTSNNDHYFHYNGEEASDVFFLNYNWATSYLDQSISRAEALGRDPYDVHAGIYAGANRSNYADLAHKKISICSWGGGGGGLPQDSPKEFLYSALKETNLYWSGPNQDPTNPGTPVNNVDGSAGYAYFIADRSAIQEYPFVTRFNTGSGVSFYIDGEKAWERTWTDASLQDVLPTWRWWWSQGGQNLKAGIDCEEAYNGSSSLRIQGNASGDNLLRLYKVKLPAGQQTELSVTYKLEDGFAGDPSGLEIGLAFENGSNLSSFTYHPVGNLTKEGWNTKTMSLSQHNGQTIAVIALRVNGSFSNYDLRLGELSLTNGEVSDPVAPANFSFQSLSQAGNKLSAKLNWELPGNPRFNESANVAYFEIYQTTSDGKSHFVGRSVARAHMFKGHSIVADGSSVNLKVVSVGLDGKKKSSSVSSQTDWNPVPVADFETEIILAGQAAVFTNKSQATVSYQWQFEGGTPATSTEVNPTVTFATPGIYSVSLKAIHADGTQDTTIVKEIGVRRPLENNTITAEFQSDVQNPQVNAPVRFSYTGDPGKTYSPTPAFDFPSGNREVSSYASVDMSGKPFTVSLWFRLDSWPKDWRDMIRIGNNLDILWKGRNISLRPRALPNNAKIGLDTPISYGEWLHLAFTYDGTTFKLYRNGKFVSEQASPGASSGAGGRVIFGNNSYVLQNFVVDELRVWEGARTQAEIQEYMYKEIPSPYPASLKHYWPMNEASGNTANDVAGNVDVNMAGRAKWTEGAPYLMAAQPLVPTNIIYDWTFTGAETEKSDKASPKVRYSEAGTYPVSLTVTTTGGTASLTKTGYITVGQPQNQAPVAVIAGSYSPAAGQQVTFSSEGSQDSDGSITSYLWDFGDENTSSLENPAHTFENAGTYTVTLTVTDDKGLTAKASKQITVTDSSAPKVKAEGGVINLTETWTTVALQQNYSSMIVVTTPVIEQNSALAPIITRIRNASGNSFEIKLQALGNGTVGTRPVHYFAAEEGTYTVEQHGVKMEARKVTSDQSAYKWNYPGKGERIYYNNTYTTPVVIGQVMTHNDPDFSVFYAENGSLVDPTQTDTYIGKHVGQDPDVTRANEVVGFIVFESGAEANLGLVSIKAGKVSDVQSFVQTPAGYVRTHGKADATGLVASIAGMRGSDGGWACLVNPDPLDGADMTLTIDEEQIGDSERRHISENVSFVAFTPVAGSARMTQAGAPTMEPAASGPTVWPNPTEGLLHIEHASGCNYEVFAQNGSFILSGTLEQSGTVDLSSLPSGTYLVRITTENETKVTRIVKR